MCILHTSIDELLTIRDELLTIMINYEMDCRQYRKWGRKCGAEESGERYPPIGEMNFRMIFGCQQ